MIDIFGIPQKTENLKKLTKKKSNTTIDIRQTSSPLNLDICKLAQKTGCIEIKVPKSILLKKS